MNGEHSSPQVPVSTEPASMPPETLEALRGSIAKWEAIVAGTGEDLGPENCALCQEFITNDCEGCPVYQATQRVYCMSTPYGYYTEGWKAFHIEGRKDIDLTALAQAELDFLKSLLPAEPYPPTQGAVILDNGDYKS